LIRRRRIQLSTSLQLLMLICLLVRMCNG
jgi:hypothetical protein